MDQKIFIKKKIGFTLTELIVVIAILAMLSAIAIPAVIGLVERSNIASDKASVKTLNDSTALYAARQNIEYADVFEGVAGDLNKMQVLVDSGNLSNIITPKQKNAVFSWNQAQLKWQTSTEEGAVTDNIVFLFKSAITGSALKYSDFLTKSTRHSGMQSTYDPSSWNGYLEKLLEAGDVVSNERLLEYDGTNTIGYGNPHSDSENIVNLPNLGYLATLKTRHGDLMPSAVLITNHSNFNHTSDSDFILSNSEILKGTIVFYKADGVSNDQTQVYYINEDGTKSQLMPIGEILP
jgi:prepilin-type N-terminal cleavage/methylation domain-containing protein